MAVGDGRYKFILAPRRELYDLQTDPGEAHDLSNEQRSRADALESALRSMLARVSQRRRRRSNGSAIDPDAEARLRALGYVGSSELRRHATRRASAARSEGQGRALQRSPGGDGGFRGRPHRRGDRESDARAV